MWLELATHINIGDETCGLCLRNHFLKKEYALSKAIMMHQIYSCYHVYRGPISFDSSRFLIFIA